MQHPKSRYSRKTAINSDVPGDANAPELISFEHSFKDNVVRISAKVKDDTAVEGVSVYCMMQRAENHWSGGFMTLNYNKSSDAWELERQLDSKSNLAFRVHGSVGMGDTMTTMRSSMH